MESSGSTEETGAVLSGRYRLLAKLGSGGMATVYLAHDFTLDRQVAVKVLRRDVSEQPGQTERFDREARDVAKLSHPNIVSVVDAGEDDGRRYIVFECIDGETLKQRIERLGRLPLDEAAAYAIEVGRGLAAAHARKLVHRDVKPQNVLIDAEGRAKLTDFGIARSPDDEDLTEVGKMIGTTDYVSPEQALGTEVDERSDIYSLGVLLYELLIGDVPFHAPSMIAVAAKHTTDDLPNVQVKRPETSAALAAVVERATRKDPLRRYPHMAEMLDDLEEALEVEVSRAGSVGGGEVSDVLSSVPRQERFLRPGRSRVRSVLGAAALAVLIAVIVFAGGGGGGSAIALPPRAAHVFDPPPGDGVEHSEETGLAVDGNPSGTPWETETYGFPTFGAAKKGVGIYVDAGKEVRPLEVEVRTSNPGWDVEVRTAAGGDPPADLNGWKIVGGTNDIGKKTRIPISVPGRARFYMLWITRLVPVGGGHYQATVDDFKLLR